MVASWESGPHRSIEAEACGEPVAVPGVRMNQKTHAEYREKVDTFRVSFARGQIGRAHV